MTSPAVRVEQVDPRLEPILRVWWETGRAAWAPDRVVEDWPAWEVSRRALPADNPERESSLYLAYDGDAVVGFGLLVLPVRDNPHLAFLDLGVLPDRRRRGHGSAIVRDLEQRVRDRGRTTVVVEGYAPPGGTAPCEPFAAGLGYALANEETLKHLDVATYRARRDAIREQVAPGLEGHRLVTWDTTCPEELVQDVCRLLGGFNGQVPLGDLALEDSEWTSERLRDWEARNRAIGRHSFSAGVVAADGGLAGLSDLKLNDAAPARASVGITLVAPEHRGRRFGLALKAAALDLAVEHAPGLAVVETWNAVSNTAMSLVNEQLGYRALERCLELQRTL